ncbi:Uncharacterised protein [Tatumella ptyseos]|uniref:Uncharacterized protein n=1 Tax=Tatumella ptyseos TaxID=82987 RepID=A0A2X5NGM6_9GAMM|nr:Uncharacterised protein [Tatumella ptyseos]
MAQRRFRIISPEAAELQPVLSGLFDEYRQRYGDYFAGHTEDDLPERYVAPEGLFIVLEEDGKIIATGRISHIADRPPKLNGSGQIKYYAGRGLPGAWSASLSNMPSMPVTGRCI